MGRSFRIDSVKVDYAKVIEPLLQEGWTSYLDMAIAILNDPVLSNNHLKHEKHKSNISKDPKLLERLKLHESIRKNKKDNKGDKGISLTNKEFAGLFKGMERNVELFIELRERRLKKYLSAMREMQSVIQQHTKRSSTKQLYIKEEIIYFTDSDDKIASYNLRPETLEFIKFVKEIKKWAVVTSDLESANEIQKIKSKYRYSDEGFAKRKNYFTKDLVFFQIYRYADSKYSLVDDLEKKSDKNKQEIEINTPHISSDLMNIIPDLPNEIGDQAIELQRSFNELFELKEHTSRANSIRQEEINRLKEEQQKGWVKEVNRIIAGKIGSKRALKIVITELLKQLDENLDDSDDIEAFHEHRINHPNPDYLPSEITSVIISNYEYYLSKIKPIIKNNQESTKKQRERKGSFFNYFSGQMRGMVSLLKKKDLSYGELEVIGDVSRELLAIGCQIQRKRQNSIKSDVEWKVENALQELDKYVEYILEVHPIVEALILYGMKPDSGVDDIIQPITRLIMIGCSENGDLKKYANTLEKLTGVISSCKNYIKTNINNAEHKITVGVVALFLATIEDDFSDQFNAIRPFIQLVGEKSYYNDKNEDDLFKLFLFYFFKTIMEDVKVALTNKDQTFYVHMRWLFYIIFVMSESLNEDWCGTELLKEVRNNITNYSKLEKQENEAKMLLILCIIKYGLNRYNPYGSSIKNASNEEDFRDTYYTEIDEIMGGTSDYDKSIIFYHKGMNKIMKKSNEIGLNNEEQQLVYFCLSLYYADMLLFKSMDLSLKEIVDALNWHKNYILKKMKCDDYKNIILVYMSEICDVCKWRFSL